MKLIGGSQNIYVRASAAFSAWLRSSSAFFTCQICQDLGSAWLTKSHRVARGVSPLRLSIVKKLLLSLLEAHLFKFVGHLLAFSLKMRIPRALTGLKRVKIRFCSTKSDLAGGQQSFRAALLRSL